MIGFHWTFLREKLKVHYSLSHPNNTTSLKTIHIYQLIIMKLYLAVAFLVSTAHGQISCLDGSTWWVVKMVYEKRLRIWGKNNLKKETIVESVLTIFCFWSVFVLFEAMLMVALTMGALFTKRKHQKQLVRLRASTNARSRSRPRHPRRQKHDADVTSKIEISAQKERGTSKDVLNLTARILMILPSVLVTTNTGEFFLILLSTRKVKWSFLNWWRVMNAIGTWPLTISKR